MHRLRRRMRDMFGNEITVEEARELLKRTKRKPTPPKGYAAPPGTGPVGETCKTCRHYALRHFSKTYRKCGLMMAHWTGGPGSDIRAGAPACRLWEAPPPADDRQESQP